MIVCAVDDLIFSIKISTAAKSLKAEKPATDSARKVVWAGTGTPRLAWETVVSGVQDDGTPSKLHVVTDATTGKEITRYEGIQTGTGNTQYSGTVSLASDQDASRRCTEVDVAGLDRPGRPPRRRLVAPVEVGMRDDLVRRRRSPGRQVLRRVGVADEGRVVASDERAVERRADAGIGLCADDDESPNSEG